VTDEMLLEAFSKFGTVLSAKVMRDELENSKGFGFVTFAFANEATSAVTAMHLNMFYGKPLYVGLAEKRDVRFVIKAGCNENVSVFL
jgi:polyadenylate-binding protein